MKTAALWTSRGSSPRLVDAFHIARGQLAHVVAVGRDKPLQAVADAKDRRDAIALYAVITMA